MIAQICGSQRFHIHSLPNVSTGYGKKAFFVIKNNEMHALMLVNLIIMKAMQIISLDVYSSGHVFPNC